MTDTLFEKIIRKEIPADIVFENEALIAFKDINPLAPVHILIVPKKKIKNLQSVVTEDLKLIGEMIMAAQVLAVRFNIAEGYRLVTNNGEEAGQTIFHLHFHLLGGSVLNPIA